MGWNEVTKNTANYEEPALTETTWKILGNLTWAGLGDRTWANLYRSASNFIGLTKNTSNFTEITKL